MLAVVVDLGLLLLSPQESVRSMWD